MSGVYETSHIKRKRSTKAEVEARRKALYAIVEAMKPMTVRQVFYQATVRGIIDKSEAGYCSPDEPREHAKGRLASV